MKILNDINLSTKIVISMFLIIFGMGIISISSYIGFSKIGVEMDEISDHQIPINSYIVKVQKDILEEEILTYRFLIACRNVLSDEFKIIEQHILKFEQQTENAIINAEKIVKKAIEKNGDKKTKKAYTYFLETLKKLEKEQIVYSKMLHQLNNDVKQMEYNNLESDAVKLEKHLNKMDTLVNVLVKKLEAFLLNSTKSTKENEHTALRIIEIISIIVLIYSCILAFFLSKQVKSSIKSFQDGLLDFFRYLNKEVKIVNLLNDKNSDEIGSMSKVVNKNIKKIEKSIEDDKKVIENTILVLSDFEKGDLHKRVDVTSENESLMQLTKLLNNMGVKLEENINNILFVLAEYSKEKYIDDVDTSSLKEHFLKLASGVNELGDKISESLILRRKNAYELQQTSSKLKANMKNLSQSTLDASTSLEETAAALEEIIRTMGSNTDNIAQMRIYATKVTDSANNGEKLATNTMTAMDDINDQTQAIAEAITVIDQIAFQTNILSLNAAVEAATAGEAGKGFAVVAGEVRNLATRSAEAAKEIKELVENATQKADIGKNTVNKMYEEYKELNKGIGKTLELITNVDGASKEQQQGVEQINEAVSQLDMQTQRNSAIAVEADEVAETTLNISNKILDDVNEKEFKGK